MRALLVVLFLCGLAAAATSTALDPLAAAVQARRASMEPHTGRERHERRVLGRIARGLAEPTTSLAGDLRLARTAARRIAWGLRGDAELTGLADAAVDDMESLARADRVRLGAWTGRLPDVLDEPRLAAGLAVVDRRFGRAAERPGAAGRAKELAIACRRMDEVRDVLGIWGDPPPPPPQMPDFALTDVNPASASHDLQVSPRDFLGKVSAWYFGKAG